MQVLYERCAGLDVHKKTVVACFIYTAANGQKQQELDTWGTTTPELRDLLAWLQDHGCTHVAMESTGEYWRPIWNMLEGQFELLLVNSRHVKAVPGRKTDVKDAEWLADLLRHGLLRGSFVPPREQRELRALTRQRDNLVRERARVVNQLQKVLEDANIKLAGVATDVTGVSGRAMLEALIHEQGDPAQLAELAHGRLRNKRAELERALTGRVRSHHRFMLLTHLTHIDFLDEQITQFSEEIHQRTHPEPPASPPPAEESAPPPEAPAGGALPPLSRADAVALLDTIPGIDQRLAEVIVAEVGTDMSRFPSADHLAAWAGVAPGSHESAGKQYSGRTTPGNRALRKGLVQAAQGAKRKKDTYLREQYYRLKGRRGPRRAIMAVAHSILVIVYHMLSRHEPYRELGAAHFDERKRDSTANRLMRRLEKLGYLVKVEEKPKPVAVPAAT
jgi:transposase